MPNEAEPGRDHDDKLIDMIKKSQPDDAAVARILNTKPEDGYAWRCKRCGATNVEGHAALAHAMSTTHGEPELWAPPHPEGNVPPGVPSMRDRQEIPAIVDASDLGSAGSSLVQATIANLEVERKRRDERIVEVERKRRDECIAAKVEQLSDKIGTNLVGMAIGAMLGNAIARSSASSFAELTDAQRDLLDRAVSWACADQVANRLADELSNVEAEYAQACEECEATYGMSVDNGADPKRSELLDRIAALAQKTMDAKVAYAHACGAESDADEHQKDAARKVVALLERGVRAQRTTPTPTPTSTTPTTKGDGQ